jgi:division protein CdvB (Snf7/Vps24/ESCRT-III family)
LSYGFSNWDEPPLRTRITGKIHRGGSLNDRLAEAIFRLQAQENRLAGAAARMQQHDKEMFDKCVRAQVAKDDARAAMYANECAQIRKMAKITLQCQLALMQASLRLETAREFGNIASMMAPVASVVKSVQGHITGIIPEVGFELAEIGEVLNNAVCDIGGPLGSDSAVQVSGEDAQKILSEANVLAEHRIQQHFPEIPTAPSPLTQRTAEQGLQ